MILKGFVNANTSDSTGVLPPAPFPVEDRGGESIPYPQEEYGMTTIEPHHPGHPQIPQIPQTDPYGLNYAISCDSKTANPELYFVGSANGLFYGNNMTNGTRPRGNPFEMGYQGYPTGCYPQPFDYSASLAPSMAHNPYYTAPQVPHTSSSSFATYKWMQVKRSQPKPGEIFFVLFRLHLLLEFLCCV